MSGPHERRVVALVIRREVAERVRARSFRVSTLLIGLAAMAGVVIPHLVSDSGPTRYDVGLVGAPAGTAQSLIEGGALIHAEVRPTLLPDPATADGALRSGAIDAAVVGTDYVVVRKAIPSSLEAVVNRAVSTAQATNALAARGIPPHEAGALLNPSPLPVHRLEQSEANTANKSLAFAGSLFLYLSLLSFGMVVANGVVEESPRVSRRSSSGP